jgi:NADH-quinone oxidoreductase subunit J
VETLVFYGLAVPIVMLALVVVTTPHILRAVVALFLALVGVGGLFFLLRCPMLGALQLMVYAGGIAVLFAFAVMMVRRVTGEFVRQTTRMAWPAALLACAIPVLFLALWQGQLAVLDETTGRPDPIALDAATRFVATRSPEEVDPKEGLSPAMLRDYVIPFEIASVLMLVAMVGAVLIGMPARPRAGTAAEAGPPGGDGAEVQ